MEGTVIKRLRERSFSRSFRHPSPPIFKSLLMARTHASFARVPGEKLAKSAPLSLSRSSLPPPAGSKSRTGKMVMAPVRVKRKVPPRFPPRFRLPLINSSLLAFRRVLSRIYLASFWKGRLGFGWIVTDTAHTCVAPPSINVASLPQSATSPHSSPCLFSPENLYASWRAFSLDNSLLFTHSAIPSLYLFFPNSRFLFFIQDPASWLPSIFLVDLSGSDFSIFESAC